jgi:hypothetical protein
LWRQRALAKHLVSHWSMISSGIRLLHKLCSRDPVTAMMKSLKISKHHSQKTYPWLRVDLHISVSLGSSFVLRTLGFSFVLRASEAQEKPGLAFDGAFACTTRSTRGAVC